jgi:hypothetical protein
MGIDVGADKSVSFNKTHDKLVITCSSKNPTEMLLRKMRVQSIFKRVMSKERDGDGNPLIYALKGKDFTISRNEIRKFVPDFRVILRSALTCVPFDIVIPMPSGHRISTIVAKRVVRLSKHGALKTDLLRKKNIGEVSAELKLLDELKIVPAPSEANKALVKLRRTLEKRPPSAPFSMKEVPRSVRKYIQPLTLTHSPAKTAPRVLLVDDLMSSGSTLISAQEAILMVFPEAHIEALCLLSSL